MCFTCTLLSQSLFLIIAEPYVVAVWMCLEVEFFVCAFPICKVHCKYF